MPDQVIRVSDPNAFLAAAQKAGMKVSWNSKPSNVVVSQPVSITTTRGATTQKETYPAGSSIPVSPEPNPSKLSGWSIQGIPVSEGVAQKIIRSQAGSNYASVKAAELKTTPLPSDPVRDGIIPVHQTASYTGLPAAYRKDQEITPESIGKDLYDRIEYERKQPAAQFAFFGEKTLTGEALAADIGAIPSMLSGNFKDYQKGVQEKWIKEQQQIVYGMLTGQKDQIFTEKALTMGITGASLGFAGLASIPAKLPTAILAPKIAAIAAAHPTGTKLLGFSMTGMGLAGVGLSTQQIAENFPKAAKGDAEAGMAFGRGAQGLAISSYLTRSGWKAITTPKIKTGKAQIKRIDYEYQSTIGENTKIKQDYPFSEIKKQTLYGDPNVKDMKFTSPDKAVYAEIKGYRKATLIPTGETKEFPFIEKIKFRVDEQAGMVKPLTNQYISEIDIWAHPKDTGAVFSLGQSIDDAATPFTFQKEGAGIRINIEDWEKSFQTIPKEIPVDTSIIKYSLYNTNPKGVYVGEGAKTIEERFIKNVLQSSFADKTITDVSYTTFNLEPETLIKNVVIPKDLTRASGINIDFGKGSDKVAEVWKQGELFNNLGIKSLSGNIEIDAKTGEISTNLVRLAQKLNIQPVITASPVMTTDMIDGYIVYPSDFKSPISFIPSLSSGTKPVVFNAPKSILTPKAALMPKLSPQLKPIMLNKSIPAIKPILNPAMTATPKLQPALQPRLQPAMQPKLQPALQPKLMPRLQPKLQPALQPKLQPKVKVNLNPKFNPDIYPDIKIDSPKEFNQITFRKRESLIPKTKAKDRLGVKPLADWLSVWQTEAYYAKPATHLKPTKTIKRKFIGKLLSNPLGFRFPTKEMRKKLKVRL